MSTQQEDLFCPGCGENRILWQIKKCFRMKLRHFGFSRMPWPPVPLNIVQYRNWLVKLVQQSIVKKIALQLLLRISGIGIWQ